MGTGIEHNPMWLAEQTCMYDNPKTMRRELWHLGKMLASISRKEVDSKSAELRGAEPWETGKIVGNPDALKDRGDLNDFLSNILSNPTSKDIR